MIEMLEYDMTDVSEGIDINKTNDLHEHIILDFNQKYETVLL